MTPCTRITRYPLHYTHTHTLTHPVMRTPGDSGLALGGLWIVQPPALHSHHAASSGFSGLPLVDFGRLEHFVATRRGTRTSPQAVALFLAPGSHVIGIVRGRAELGPRALGHRSLIGYPVNPQMKATYNLIKGRQAFRPVAPIIPESACEQFFGRTFHSPFMSFAPPLLKHVAEKFSAIAHVDGTSRLQTLQEQQDPWLWALLQELGRLTGWPIVANSSFNRKGQAMINTLDASFLLLDGTPELSGLVVEEWWFEQRHRI